MESGWLKLIIPAVIILLTLIWPIIQRLTKGEEKQTPAQPASGGGYEDLISQLVGGGPPRPAQEPVQTVQIDDEEEVWLDDEPSPPPLRRTPAPVIRIIEEAPAPRPGMDELLPVSAWGRPGKAVSLEDRIFANRRLSTGAKMVLASEILRRPGSPRF